MATVLGLVGSGALVKIDPALDGNRQELRTIYASPRLIDWLGQELPALESTWKVEESPAEQLDALFETFCSGDTLTFEHQFKPLNHIQDGVWELKTADLRVFGFFPMRDCFVGVAANPKDLIKRHKLYPGHRGGVVHFRDNLDLDAPKFVQGDDPNDVVSNYTYL